MSKAGFKKANPHGISEFPDSGSHATTHCNRQFSLARILGTCSPALREWDLRPSQCFLAKFKPLSKVSKSSLKGPLAHVGLPIWFARGLRLWQPFPVSADCFSTGSSSGRGSAPLNHPRGCTAVQAVGCRENQLWVQLGAWAGAWSILQSRENEDLVKKFRCTHINWDLDRKTMHSSALTALQLLHGSWGPGAR